MDAEERIEQLTLELARTQEELARVNARLNAIMQGADCVAAVLKNGCNQVDQSVFDEDKLHVGARGFHTFIEFFRDITSRQCDSDLRVVSFVVNHLQQKSKSGRPADLVQGYG